MEFLHKKPISYSCKKCGYTTNRKSNFLYHMNRKIPCVAVETELSNVENAQEKVNDSHNVNATIGQNINDIHNVNAISGQNINDNFNVNATIGQNINDSHNINAIIGQNIIDSHNINDDGHNVNDINLVKNNENICEKCNKHLSSKKSLVRHMSTCKGVHSLQCPKCKKEFKTAQGKHQHLKNVTCIPINPHYPMTVNNTTNNTTNNNTTNNTTNNNINNNTINNDNKIIHNHTHIQINAFGKENYDYLLDENKRLKNIMQKKDAFMQKIIEAVHFDEEHPENHNILMTNLQSKHVMIHDGTKFIKALKEPTLVQLIQNKRNLINGNIETLGLTIGSERYIKEKLDTLRQDDEKQKMLKDKVELMCYNKRTMCEEKSIISEQ